jgi:RNase P subunit RPR2
MQKWVFAVTCATCEKPIILGNAPSPEQNEHSTHRGVEVTCPLCTARHTYRGTRVARRLVEGEDE